jgi:hypothetical protein
LEVGQDFYRAGGVQPSNQEVKAKLQKFPTPCKRRENQPRGNYTLVQKACSCQNKTKIANFSMKVGL